MAVWCVCGQGGKTARRFLLGHLRDSGDILRHNKDGSRGARPGPHQAGMWGLLPNPREMSTSLVRGPHLHLRTPHGVRAPQEWGQSTSLQLPGCETPRDPPSL